MNDINISNCDDQVIQFRGQLVHQAEWSEANEEGRRRSLSLALYAVEHGGYVVSVEFKSELETESSKKIVEQIDCLDDVDKFFYIFDMHEAMGSESGMARSEKEHRSLVTKRLAKEYETIMFQFLDDAKSELVARGFGDRIDDPVAEPTSVWKKLFSK